MPFGHHMSQMPRTVILCKPQISQSCLSSTGFVDQDSSSEASGLPHSVIIYIVVSDSTASINFKTSGCRVTRSFRSALRARGCKFRFAGTEPSNSNTETGAPSSYILYERVCDPTKERLRL